MAVTVVFEIEYDVEEEDQARALAERDAGHLISMPEVEAITVSPKAAYLRDAKADDLPITARYLEDDE